MALDHVLELLSDHTFREAIVIEGAAGSGKSSFTLHLCDRLLDEGWRPIRVRLHHLGVSNSFREGLAEAIQKSGDPALHELTTGSTIGNVFDVFAETMEIDGTPVCPWAVILDGWDEISISATEGFRQKVEKLLGQVRETLLGREVNPIRVILTGRPSADVRQSNFMRPETVVLRILPLDPDELREFAAKISKAQKAKRIQPPANAPQWAMPPLEHFAPAFEDYRRAFLQESQDRGSLDVLGSPLLAHLALRLMSAESAKRIQELVATPTTLLRRLVDLTCSKAGQPANYEMDQENKAHGEYANFSRAKMRGAFLVKHNLLGVYAAGAVCNGATVVLASLRNADLSGADLRGVLFDNVDVQGTDITGAQFGTTGVTAGNLIANGATDRNQNTP